MNLKNYNSEKDETIFVSAIKHEIFSRIFPTIRHDVVGNISASLIRLSIIDRVLKLQDLNSEKIKSEILKLDQNLRSSINEIRDLAFWDFESNSSDYSYEILKKSILLMATQLAFKGISLNLQDEENVNPNKIDTKTFLFSLLCIFCYIEDNDFENFIFKIYNNINSVFITFEPSLNKIEPVITKNRNIKIDIETMTDFISINNFQVQLNENQICLNSFR